MADRIVIGANGRKYITQEPAPMTDRELMDKAWDYLAAYTVGERPNSSDVNDLVFALESRLAQPKTPDVTPDVTPYVIDCPRCGHCCPQRP